MMESNLINEQTATMKTQLFQPKNNLVKNILFIRNSILPGAGDAIEQQQKNECLCAVHNNTSVYKLKSLAHPGLIPAAVNKAAETVIGTTTNIKNSFMRTFLRKSGAFAIALLIVNLFFAQQNFGQTVVVTNPY